VLEKGILTVIPVLALHHDPKYYPDPERFDPERFSEEEKAKRHHYVYLPFGEGPRMCIGEFTLIKYCVKFISYFPWNKENFMLKTSAYCGTYQFISFRNYI
jgi:cytochrome P450 family 6